MTTSLNALPRLLTPEQTAAELGVTKQTLAVWRATARYPLPYVKCGAKVMYKADDVAAFIEGRRVTAHP